MLLLILDGFGVAPKSPSNAISEALTPNLNTLWNNYPHTYLLSSSESVGLPPDTKGNSEVGHLNLGAGKIVYQNLPRINRSIENKSFFSNKTLEKAWKHAKVNNSNIHIMGCASDGSVHSHISHLKAIINFLSEKRINKKTSIYLHLFLDGRDSPPKSASKYLSEIDSYINDNKRIIIGSLCGRYYSMDRGGNWDRTQKAYDLLTKLKGKKAASWKKALEESYQNGISDEFFEPTVVNSEPIKDNDCVIFFNFRADRAIQLSNSFCKDGFTHFSRIEYKNLLFTGMMEYERNFPQNIIFPKDNISLPVGRIISENGLKQLRIAESEKFPHVTYFFNGGTNIKYPAENRIEISSPSVATYDLAPEMSALKLTEVLENRIEQNYYNFIVANFANGDMVGHTGNLEASKLAVEVVDHCVGRLVKKFLAYNGTVIITADHGNVEELVDLETGEIDTEHSINPVPMIIINGKIKEIRLPLGILADVAPTALKLMGIRAPSEMNGKPLL